LRERDRRAGAEISVLDVIAVPDKTDAVKHAVHRTLVATGA